MAVVLDVSAVGTANTLHDGQSGTQNPMVVGAVLTGVPSTVTATIWYEAEGGPMGEYYWPTAMTLDLESGGQFTGLTGNFNADGALWDPTGDATATTVETETGTWQAITITQSAGDFFGNIPPVDEPFDIRIFFDAAYGWDEEYAGAIDFSGTFGVSVVANSAEAPGGSLLSSGDLARMRSIQALALPDSIQLLELSSDQNELGEEAAPASYNVIGTVPGRLAVDSVTRPFDAGRPVETEDYIITFANDTDLSEAVAFRVFDEIYVRFGEAENRGRSWRTAQRVKVRRSDLQDDASVA